MSEKYRGFVLHHTDLSAGRAVVTLFTQTGGKRKGVMRFNKKQTRACLTPLTCLGFHLSGKEHVELKRMDEIDLIYHHFDRASNYLGLSLLQHWAGLVMHSQPGEHEDIRVFRLLNHSVLSFGGCDDPKVWPLLNIYFEVWLLHFCGVLPRIRTAQAPHSMQNERDMDENLRLWRSLHNPILVQIFKSRIEELVENRLKLGALKGAFQVLGEMWEQFLGRGLEPRKLLMNLFAQRDLL